MNHDTSPAPANADPGPITEELLRIHLASVDKGRIFGAGRMTRESIVPVAIGGIVLTVTLILMGVGIHTLWAVPVIGLAATYASRWTGVEPLEQVDVTMTEVAEADLEQRRDAVLV